MRGARVTGLTLAVVLAILVAEAAAFAVRDMQGREIVLAAPPQRIVSLSATATNCRNPAR